MDYVIIVAGGKGLRMGGDIPKQFLPIGGKPVLMRTIDRFREYDKEIRIILVLPKAQQNYWQELCQKFPSFNSEEIQIADGGQTRFHSVQNGLNLVPDDAQGGDYRLVQTPQVFDIQLLKKANKQEYKDSFTDDASVVEGIGQKVTMVEGNRENIKITTPFDIKIAEALLK